MPKQLTNRAKRRKLEREVNSKKTNQRVDIPGLIKELKYDFSKPQVDTFFKSNQNFFNLFPDLPKSNAELRKIAPIFWHDDFLKELRWYVRFIEKYKLQINHFLDLQILFEERFISGDYKEASAILTKIESEICVSHWGVEKKLLLAEYENGFKQNKEVLTNVIHKENNAVTNILAKFQSIRIEKNLSFVKASEIINGYIKKYSNSPTLRTYFQYKLDFYSHSYFDNNGSILNVESGSSIIDKYTTFINLICLFVCQYKNQTHFEEVVNIISKLIIGIADPRINSILWYLGQTPPMHLTQKNLIFIDILELYTDGHYERVVDQCKTALINNPTCFELYEIYIKSTQFLNRPIDKIFLDGSIAASCIEDLNNILNKNAETQQSLLSIHKVFNSIGLNSWAHKLFCFFKQEYSLISDNENSSLFSHLISGYFNPIFATFLMDVNRLKYLNCLNKNAVMPSTAGLITYELTSDEKYLDESNINSIRKIIYKIKHKIEKQDYEEAIKDINLLEAEESSYLSVPYVQESLLKFRIHSLLSLKEWSASLDLIVDSNIANPNLLNKIVSAPLVDHVLTTNDPTLQANISLPIFIHQYQNYISNNNLWIAYDNFLSCRNLNFPKEIDAVRQDFKLERLVYFLKNVCRQDVFDSSYLFENQDELDNERIDICSILTKIDKLNYEDYINEISEISRIQLVRRGIKQIDESKIYVDVKGIKKSTEADIKESFERSLRLANLSLDKLELLDDNVDNVIVAFYGKSPDSNKIEIKESNIHITSYSRFRLFADMFYKLRDKFIASNEFGIDTYLSMRIRHGTLQGEIRSVFEKHNLVTKKDESSNSYKDNDYWLRSLGVSDKIQRENFNNVMAELSTGVDNISNVLKNKKLQIKTEKKASDGFFDYSYSESELLRLFSEKFGAIVDYEEFFTEIIDELWIKTERNLQIIREHVANEIRTEMLALLTIQPKLDTFLSRFEFHELNRLYRAVTECQTDISNELSKISEWFKRSNSQTINDFTIDLPIDTTIKTLRRLFKDFENLQPTIEINCPIIFDGEFFPHFTYIFQNLLHNIIQHADLSYVDLLVSINVTQVDGSVVINIKNNISENIDLETLNNSINEKMILLKKKQVKDNEKIRSEDGTGYLKVHKTVRIDLFRENYFIDIKNVDESRIFETEIKFEFKGLQKILNEIAIN